MNTATPRLSEVALVSGADDQVMYPHGGRDEQTRLAVRLHERIIMGSLWSGSEGSLKEFSVLDGVVQRSAPLWVESRVRILGGNRPLRPEYGTQRISPGAVVAHL